MKPVKGQRETCLRLINDQSQPVTLILEPWGEVFELQPRDDCVLFFLSAVAAQPEVSLGDDAITVWGWTGSLVRVVMNGVQIRDYGEVPVPPMPVQPLL